MADLDYLPAPLERPADTFSVRAVVVLRDMVLTGKLRAGERLNEVELASALGISRGPLREAIQRLRSEGLLTTVSHRGAFVRSFSDDELRQLYEVRIALETHAVRLAVRDANAPGIRALRELLVATKEAMTTGPAYPRDLDFHRDLVALTGNQTLIDVTTDVHRKIDLARSRSAHQAARARDAFEEHEQIVDHMEKGRAETAVKVLTRHLLSSLESALEILDADRVPPQVVLADGAPGPATAIRRSRRTAST
jgi:DNA-binding GntR family transcriptional regulator